MIKKLIVTVIIFSIPVIFMLSMLHRTSNKKAFDPTDYPENLIAQAQYICGSNLQEKEVREMLVKACKDLGRLPIEKCNFSGFELNAIKWETLRKCEQEYLEKQGSI